MATSFLGPLLTRAAAAIDDAAEERQHSLDVKEHVDFSFGLKGELTALGDAAGEAAGVGAISSMDLNANSARMSAMQIQKQLAMETINIVNAAPQALLNLLT